VYLIRPTTTVTSLTTSSADVISETVSVDPGFTRADPSGKLFHYRSLGVKADAIVEGTGPSGAQVGYLQFVRDDKRIGKYLPSAGGPLFTLDFSRCTKQYLPCKDVGESMAVFSGEPVLDLQPGPTKAKGPVHMHDFPGNAFPTSVKRPKAGRLAVTEWSMEFVAVLGIREGSLFNPLHHFIWRVDSDRINPLGPDPRRTEGARLVAGAVPGAPAGLDIDKAMGLQTCRFTMRRIESEEGGDPSRAMCQPHLV
jgi:hypothetical protein